MTTIQKTKISLKGKLDFLDDYVCLSKIISIEYESDKFYNNDSYVYFLNKNEVIDEIKYKLNIENHCLIDLMFLVKEYITPEGDVIFHFILEEDFKLIFKSISSYEEWLVHVRKSKITKVIAD